MPAPLFPQQFCEDRGGMTLAGDGVEEGQVQERTLVQPLRTRPPGEETSQREDGQIAEVIGLSSELGICWVASRTWLRLAMCGAQLHAAELTVQEIDGRWGRRMPLHSCQYIRESVISVIAPGLPTYVEGS